MGVRDYEGALYSEMGYCGQQTGVLDKAFTIAGTFLSIA
jgi:hypothetical protein